MRFSRGKKKEESELTSITNLQVRIKYIEFVPRMMFFVWEKNEKSEDVRNENVDVVEVSLLNTLQLLRDEVDKNLEI